MGGILRGTPEMQAGVSDRMWQNEWITAFAGPP
jgi:hypothetical protein